MTSSLRETKRMSTMKDIQRAAIDLIGRHGFASTTVEDIAREAGVGPATVYRHFETKERIFLWDEYDEGFTDHMHALIAAEGLVPALEALRHEIDEHMDGEQKRRHRARLRLVDSEPALLRESVANGIDIANMIATGLATHAKRTAPSTEDFAIGHMIAGLFHALMMGWAKQDDDALKFETMLNEALAALHEEIYE